SVVNARNCAICAFPSNLRAALAAAERLAGLLRLSASGCAPSVIENAMTSKETGTARRKHDSIFVLLFIGMICSTAEGNPLLCNSVGCNQGFRRPRRQILSAE